MERVLVFGIGLTGQSCVRHLSHCADIYVSDTRMGSVNWRNEFLRPVLVKYPNVRLIDPDQVGTTNHQFDVAVISPGISYLHPVVNRLRKTDVRLISDMDLFLQQTEKPVIAVTGTNGKSSVVTLIEAMLQDCGFTSAGNIGLPVLDVAIDEHEGFVLELSSFQLERMQPYRFRSATCLNITSDHMDQHASHEQYAAAKRKIYTHAQLAVFNSHDPETHPFQRRDRVISINSDEAWSVRDDGITIDGEEISTERIALTGKHNLFNLVCAAALARDAGASMSRIEEICSSFQGLRHRLEVIGESRGVTFINDSKATNVAATIAAIESFKSSKKRIHLILGGQSKKAELTGLVQSVANHVKRCVIFGEDRERFENTLGDCCPFTIADNLEDAVGYSMRHAGAGDVVMLSPAAASFDMFDNYIHRGDVFRDAVQRLTR